MTPKEKAKELVDKMWNIDERCGSIGFHEAKQCALIAVDEVLKVLKQLEKTEYKMIMSENFWLEVREEIEKL